ncbi:hypothetical protein LPB140_03465 [Sphingorhabdus lutea]|uniref:Uncharacterized protein n=1 Tax=Sphingorhabdus lutea TaxID=1913578 RepID=A0A1L3JA80_9SPHN|nr:hypothetical protein [Sphingorhabdus lutea]APG62028.1 hypothetical protein LPB140_03465 [Sphingorhabdus lutea]
MSDFSQAEPNASAVSYAPPSAPAANITAQANAQMASQTTISAPAKPRSAIIDMIAFITGSAALAGGLLTLFAPLPIEMLTGMGEGIGADAVAAQWSIFGLLLIFGSAAKLRAISIFAAEFLLISSLCLLAILIWREAGSVSVGIQIAVAALAFITSGLARIADKVEMSRDLKLTRQQVAAMQSNPT